MVTGSLQEKSGKFYAVLNLKDEKGKRKTKWIATGLSVKGNKRRAEAILADLTRRYTDLQERPLIQKANMLYADYVQEWLRSIKPKVQITTYNSYESMTNLRIAPFFRNLGLTLREVRPSHIEALYNEILAEGYTANTVIHYHAVIHKSLKKAVRDEIIPFNPADKVEKPKVDRFDHGFYNEAEMTTLFEAAKGDPLYALIKVTAYYGLRRSEVLGLRWSAIDFEEKTITINNKIIETVVDGKFVPVNMEKLKNNSSRRMLPLLPDIEKLLLDVKARQAISQKLMQKAYCQKYLDYIFTDDLGVIFRPNYVTSHFRWLLEHYHLKRIRFHDLRHSCASILLKNGIPMKVIQEWLGHSNFSTTADIYAHLEDGMKRDAGSILSDALSGDKKSAHHPTKEQ